MEKATLDDVIVRLDRLEKTIAELTGQLSELISENTPDNAKKNIRVEKSTDCNSDKSGAYVANEIFAGIYKKMGISPNFELRPLKELRESMRKQGVRPEDNEFSRTIIEERDK